MTLSRREQKARRSERERQRGKEEARGLGVRGNSLAMLTGSPESRHSAASFKLPICIKRQHSDLTSVVTVDLKLLVLKTTV